jgi:DNA mismatch endonuclease (patch repair protein)
MKDNQTERKSETPTERISRLMRANTNKNTDPELRLRHALWAMGTRGYRTNFKSVPGKPDLAFTRVKLAVFVHGCYWHQCPKCQSKKAYPRANVEFWNKKFADNKARDERKSTELKALGWHVHTVWECEVKQDVDVVAKEISAFLRDLSVNSR